MYDGMSKTILLVDDNLKIRELFTSYLELKEYQVTNLENGLAVIDEMKNHTYDIVMLDLAMPEMSGFEVLEKMKEGNLPTNNVIVLTAADLTDEDREKIKSYEIKAFLEKPAELSTIMALISC